LDGYYVLYRGSNLGPEEAYYIGKYNTYNKGTNDTRGNSLKHLLTMTFSYIS
jgi:hypothetical protein